ncbi:hypothetical protein O181_014588 [Austropuccinia psidii MF-1]|uniref:RWD domain-containing protein n=1 Tax=Austropuccinia psidii MF-1 TaxID=1389203 RepID=A0A9Q3C0U2_9BASI|nr:hypothetical protein [Austropuccinia psidii MF-1]
MSEQYLEQRREEIEVLQSIFEDLTLLADDQVVLKTQPEVQSASDPLTVNLKITYTDSYPDELPQIQVEPIEGELSEGEMEAVLYKLQEVAQESLGMAMIFTLSLSLQQELDRVLSARTEEQLRAEQEAIKRAEELEATKSKGTPVTKETFLIWKAKYDQEVRLKKLKEEDERLKTLPPKEREEQRKGVMKMTGRELFESNKALVASDNFALDADAVELDLTGFANEQASTANELSP